MMRTVKTLAAAFILLFVVLFVYQNNEALNKPISFKFDFSFFSSSAESPEPGRDADQLGSETSGSSFQTHEFPAVVWFLAFFIAGVLSSGTYSTLKRASEKLETRKLRKKIKQLEADLARQRVAAVAPPPQERIPREPNQAPKTSVTDSLEENPTL